jgi:hypothetical protein
MRSASLHEPEQALKGFAGLPTTGRAGQKNGGPGKNPNPPYQRNRAVV